LTHSCRSNTPSWARVSAPVFVVTFILCALLLAGFPFPGSARLYAQANSPQSQRIWIQDAQPLQVTFDSPAIGAPTRVAQTFAGGKAQPLTLVNGRFYEEDGIEGMAVGYATASGGAVALYRGNLDAFAPQSEESFLAIGQGRFPAPFLPSVRLFELPERPDFLAAGQFTGTDDLDIVAASKGSSALYILANNGFGNFTPEPVFTLPGTVTALGTANFGSALATSIVVAVNRPQGPALLVYATSRNGLYLTAAYPLSAPATALAFGNLDGDGITDVAVIAGGEVSVLQGRNLTSLGSVATPLVSVPLPFTATAIALGHFIGDRDNRDQMALLASDGSLNIVARKSFDPTPWTLQELQNRRRGNITGHPDAWTLRQGQYRAEPWNVIENVPAVAASSSSAAPVLMRTHITDYGTDDVMVLDSAAQQMTVIAHPNDFAPGAVQVNTFPAAERLTRPYIGGSPVAALPMRVNIDGRPGVVALHGGNMAPFVAMPTPDPTFFPNRFDDIAPRAIASTCANTTGVDGSGDCTLREAIRKANATAGADTIMLQAGTYTLSQPKIPVDYTATGGTLDVTDSLTITGQVNGGGTPTTIIQAGTTNANGVDKIFSFNQDITAFTNATVSISNLELRFGRNLGDALTNQDGFGGAFDFDTGGTNPATATATLTITNCNIHDNKTTDGEGGGFEIFNTNSGTGFATITNSFVQNNTTLRNPANGDPNAAGNGGGITMAFPAKLVMNNTQVLNNLATQVQGTGIGQAGGIFALGGGGIATLLTMHGGAVTGNQSAADGGGIWSTAGLTIDQGAVISNNTSGTAGTGSGGGIWFNGDPGDPANLTKVTITGNHAATNGGGIHVDAAGQPMTISFSRFAGNTAGGIGGNLDNRTGAAPGSVVTATNNWWGTNAASTTITPSTSHCPAAAQQVCFDPFIVLTHNATPAIIRINQSTTLTGDMSKDNHGNGAALAGNLNQIIGLPITFDNPVLGTIPQAQPETLNGSAQATATFNAGATSGRGSANATVDQAVIGANSNLIANASEAANTVTITTVGAHNFAVGETVVISGVTVGGYNGTFAITSVNPPLQFSYTNPTGGLGASSGGTAKVGIIILEPLQITKSFSPTAVAVNAPSTLTFSVNNPNVIAVDGTFTDTLPVNLVVANPPAATNTCGGTFSPVAGAGSVTLNDPTVPIGTCTATVHVSSAIDNIYNNSVTINSVAAGTNGLSSSASLTVINPPTIAKVFGASAIPLNGTTSLTITVSSTNVNLTLNGITFTDSLPAGLVVANPNNLTDTCSGAATAVSGSSSVSLATSSLAPGASCTVTVNVQGTTAGTKNNSVAASDTTAGTGNTASASLEVIGPPTISKAFNPVSIPLNGTSTLTFTITNPNTTAVGDLTGVAFSDSLPVSGGPGSATLVVSSTPSVTNTCGGTVTATAGTGVITLSGASVAHNASCTLSVNVTGTVAGDGNNTTGAISSTEGGTGTTSNTATLKVVAPPSIAKAFNPTSTQLNNTSLLTFTITNPAANTVALTGVAFTDTLPTGLTVASNTSTVCGGTLTTTNPTGISLTGATIATGGTCQFSVTVTGATAGQYTNTTGAVSSTNGGTGNTATANLTVVAPPSVAKAFNPTTIPLNGTTTLTITITNPAVNAVALSPVTLNDILPTGLTVASGIVSDPCGLGSGVLHTTAPTTIQIGGVTIPANGQCVVNVTVTGATAGQYTNTTGSVSSGNGGTGNTASANLTVVGPPTISKVFNPTSIPRNGTSTVTFTINNPNTSATADISGVAFSDTLPVSGGPGSATLVVSSTPNVSNTCGGTVTATAGTGVISLSGASVAHNSSCTLSVDVKGTVEGDANNTTGAISSTQGGTGTTSNTATLKVVAPPTISKAFGAANIALNGTTTVTFTITNPASNTSAENGIAFSDTLTNGLQVASTPGVSNTCGGTVTAAANSTSISLTGGSVATPGSTCTIVVNVTGTQSGTVTNTTGAVSSTNGGTGATSNTATLIVASPATVTKVFGATKIPLNGTTSLTINITNPNTNVALTGLSFTDSLPAGLVVANPNGLTNTCGGTATATAGSGSVSLSGGTVASSASCAVSVNVQGTTAGDKINSVTVSSTEGGASTAAIATVTVVAPPTISKAFAAGSIPLNGVTTVTFTIANPNNPGTPANGDLTGVAFSDTLPVSGGPGSATLVVSSTPNVTNTCGGTVTATAGSGVISLSGGSVAHNTSCALSVDVRGTVEGDANNTTGAITSTEGGTGTASNTATLKVVAPPVIAKAFGAAAIPLNGTTSLTFTLTNPATNTAAETGVAFTDTLPAGLVVATPNGIANTCGGTATAVAGSGAISLTGVNIGVNSNCTLVVNITGTASGSYTNVTGAVTSTNGGTGNTASAHLFVAAPPTITKAFGAAAIPFNGSTSLTFTIANPAGNLTLTGISFTDNLPAGLVVATPNGLTNTCGGTATATSGSGVVSLIGVTLATNTSCTLTVNVTGTTGGVKNNTTGAISSNESGPGATSNTATLTVVSPPTISKAFGAASIPLNGTTSLTFTINNPNGTTALTGVAFTDNLPAGLVVATPNGLANTCGGVPTATAGSVTVSLTAGAIAAGTNCTLSVNVTGTAAGTMNNTTGAITSTEGGTGATSNTATVTVVAPPAIVKVFNPTGIPVNGFSTLTITITNPAANTVAEAGVAFTDNFPASLVVATPNGLTNTCGGTATATAGSGIVSLTGGTVAVNSSCNVTVNVTSAVAGTYVNSTGPVSSTNGGTGGSASATLTVAAPPTLIKAFGAASIPLNGSTSLTFTVTNPAGNIALTGISFTDNLPAGLVVATPNALANTCGGTATAVAGSSSVSLTGVSRAANTSCTLSINVTGTTAGVKNNTAGPISSNESGPGGTASASITVVAPPSIAKNFGAASIFAGANTTLTFTITNPNAGTALTGVAFADNLPGGLVVATPNGLAGACGGGTITAAAGSGSVTLTGATIAAAGNCTFSVNVTGIAGGNQVNTTGNVTSTNGGTGNTATASIVVNTLADMTITKSHIGNFFVGQTGATYTITVSNVGTGASAGTVTVTDTLPASLTATAMTGTGWTCTVGTLTCTRTDALANGSAYPPITLTVNVAGNAPASVTNTATVSGGGELNVANDTANDVTTISPLFITITPGISTATVKRGQIATYTFTVNASVPGPITLLCSNLPQSTACNFNPLSPASNGTTAETLSILTTAPPGLSMNQAPSLPGSRPVYVAMLSLPMLGLIYAGIGAGKNKRKNKGKTLRLIILGIVMLGVMAIAGCGGHGRGFFEGTPTPPGTYTVTVTASSGAVSAQTNVTLTVTP